MTRQKLADQSMKTFQDLPFEVLAVPQDNDHLSNVKLRTLVKPVNIKIRVKNKEEFGVKRGVISVPRFGVNKNARSMRLVKSDQTIVSFDLLIEPDTNKKTQKKNHKKIFQMFKSGCFTTQNDDDDIPYLPSSSDREKQKTNVATDINKLKAENFAIRKNFVQDTTRVPIFLGKCKPGGCLDPPFNEDKYSYEPAIKLSPLSKVKPNQEGVHDEKLNTINNEYHHIIKIPNIRTEITSNMLLEPHISKTAKENISGSTSIITYPPAVSSSEIQMLKQKHNNGETSKMSSERKLKHSINEFTELYMPSKKEKSQNLDETDRKSQNKFSSSYVNKKIDYSLISQDQSKISLSRLEDRTTSTVINPKKSETNDDSERCKVFPSMTRNVDEITISSLDMLTPGKETKITLSEELNGPLTLPTEGRKKSLIPICLNIIPTPIDESKIFEDMTDTQSNTYLRSENSIKSLKFSSKNEISLTLSETKANVLSHDIIKIRKPYSLISQTQEKPSFRINENLISNVVIEKKKSEINNDINETSGFTENDDFLSINQVNKISSHASIDKNKSNSSTNKVKSHARRTSSLVYLQFNDNLQRKSISLENKTSESLTTFSIQDKKNVPISQANNFSLSSLINSETSVQQSIAKEQFEIKKSEEYIISPKITLEEPLNYLTQTIMNDPILNVTSEKLVKKDTNENNAPKELLLMMKRSSIILQRSLSYNTKNYNASYTEISPIENYVSKLSTTIKDASPEPHELLNINIKDVLHNQVSQRSLGRIGSKDKSPSDNYEMQNINDEPQNSTSMSSSMVPTSAKENIKYIKDEKISEQSISALKYNPTSTVMDPMDTNSLASNSLQNYEVYDTENRLGIVDENDQKQSSSPKKDLLNENYIIDDNIITPLKMSVDYTTKALKTSIEHLKQKTSADILDMVENEVNQRLVIRSRSESINISKEDTASEMPIALRTSTAKDPSVVLSQDTTQKILHNEASLTNQSLKDTLTVLKELKSLDRLLKIKNEFESNINNNISSDVQTTNIKNELKTKLMTKINDAQTSKNLSSNSPVKDLEDDMFKDSIQSINVEKIHKEYYNEIPNHILRNEPTVRKRGMQENTSIVVNAKFRYSANEKNKLTLETCDPFMPEVEKTQEKILFIKTILRNNDDEIRVPVDSETDVILQIKKQNIPKKNDADPKVNMELNKNLFNMKMKDKDELLQETLNTVYESLLPLQNIMSNIREEAQSLVKQQIVIKELLSTLETKPVRLNPERACRCHKI